VHISCCQEWTAGSANNGGDGGEEHSRETTGTADIEEHSRETTGTADTEERSTATPGTGDHSTVDQHQVQKNIWYRKPK
jgi:hypothetical protein